MGILIELGAQRQLLTPELRALLAVGMLGGFTTFSSFALDVATLWERGDLIASGAYAAGSTALSILALFTGLWVVREVLARSEEHTSELQSLMRNSYAVFCFTKNNDND